MMRGGKPAIDCGGKVYPKTAKKGAHCRFTCICYWKIVWFWGLQECSGGFSGRKSNINIVWMPSGEVDALFRWKGLASNSESLKPVRKR
jgi:hypothetical protein